MRVHGLEGKDEGFLAVHEIIDGLLFHSVAVPAIDGGQQKVERLWEIRERVRERERRWEKSICLREVKGYGISKYSKEKKIPESLQTR